MSAAPLALLCLPCAGASAVVYMRWSHLLPAWIRLVPVELPGRGSWTESEFSENFDELVAHLCDEYATELQAPYALFGHSMGSLLAYGIAHSQYANFKPLPATLFACATAAPSKRASYPLAEKYTDDELIADLRRHGGAPEDVFETPNMLRQALDTLAADYRLIRTFQYRKAPRLPLPIHVFAGRRDDVDAEHLEAWQEESSSRFSLQWFDGGHFFLRSQPERLLERIVHELRSAREDPQTLSHSGHRLPIPASTA